MRNNIKTLQEIVSRRGSSKVLSFGEPHVLKALQIMNKDHFASRNSLCKQLKLGEGAVKTLILHLKEHGLVDSIRAGTFLTEKGMKFVNEFLKVMPAECFISNSRLTKSKNNYAILLLNMRGQIRSGIEQRDAAILYDAKATITMVYHRNKFVFPGEESDCLQSDKKIRNLLLEHLKPNEGDVIILTSSNDSFSAEMGAKNSALITIAS